MAVALGTGEGQATDGGDPGCVALRVEDGRHVCEARAGARRRHGDCCVRRLEEGVGFRKEVGSPVPAAEGVIDEELHTILADAPCDVGLLVARPDPGFSSGRPIMVPFTGAAHDWAAIEIAAWMSRSLGTSLRLVGPGGDPATGQRDASRLLARASLMVQQAIGVVTDPVLVEAGHQGLIAATVEAGLLVLGLSPRWREEGLGDARLAVARDARPPTLLVRRGVRPGGLAPRESITRFTWTLASSEP
jgi:hypothetical protein